MSGKSSTTHIEYSNENELLTEFKNLMQDPANLETATNYLYQSLLDEAILGVAFEVHYAHKTKISEAIEGLPEDTRGFNIVDRPNIDVFGSSTAKITMYCTCPICDRSVEAGRFAPHLEKCMGKYLILWTQYLYVTKKMAFMWRRT